jgi:hypothetical protein
MRKIDDSFMAQADLAERAMAHDVIVTVRAEEQIARLWEAILACSDPLCDECLEHLALIETWKALVKVPITVTLSSQPINFARWGGC